MPALGKQPVSDNESHSVVPPLPAYPLCPTCGVPMWLERIACPTPGNRTKDRLHFECQVCNARAVLPPLN